MPTPAGTKGRVLHSEARYYDLLAWLLTLGRERAFRERLVELARLEPGEAVLGLAKRVLAEKGLRFRGLQGYDGHLQMAADRAEKKARYFEISSLQHYAIVEQDEVRIDLYTRVGAQWSNEVVEGMMATLILSALKVRIGLASCYEGTSLDQGGAGHPTG
jgi:hypothetical protein